MTTIDDRRDRRTSTAPRTVGVLVSGGGRSLENLVEVIAKGELDARIGVIVSSTPGAFALERARRHGIPAVVLDPDRRQAPLAFGADAFATLETFGCDTAVLAGFLRLVLIPERWAGRVLNIHPSLLPAFGGKGFYGRRVHEAVLARGCEFTGCTVHYVTNEYDAGPIVHQRCVAVRREDTPDSLAARVFEEEKLALPEALRRHFAR